MSIILIPPADAELSEAIAYYNDQHSGLGDQFYRAFLLTTDEIVKAPTAWRKIGQHTRRINFRRFPYLVLYVVDDNDILITCIAHQHRNSTYYLADIT